MPLNVIRNMCEANKEKIFFFYSFLFVCCSFMNFVHSVWFFNCIRITQNKLSIDFFSFFCYFIGKLKRFSVFASFTIFSLFSQNNKITTIHFCFLLFFGTKSTGNRQQTLPLTTIGQFFCYAKNKYTFIVFIAAPRHT